VKPQDKQRQQLRLLSRKMGILRPADLAAAKIPKDYLKGMVRRGELEKVARGLYGVPGGEVTENHTMAGAAKKIPSGVVCLLSALRFHGLTTQNPFEVWMAIENKAWRPKLAYPPVRLVHFSGSAFQESVEEHLIEGVPVKIYGPAKTVADCLKFRNKIGLDVAREAVRDYRRKYKTGMDALWKAAAVCRIQRVIRPYLEAGL